MSRFTAVSILTEIQISALWANTLIRSAVSEPTAAVQKELSHCLVCQFSAFHLPNTNVHVEAGLD